MTKARLTRLATAALLAVVALGGGAAVWSYRAMMAPGPATETKTIVVARGSGLRDIARQLASGGVIAHPSLFSLAAWLDGSQHALRAGEYAFDAQASMQDVLAILREGKTVVRRVTLAEGLTSQEMMAVLAEAHGLTGTIDPVPPEGSLLPDTYHYSLDDARSEVVGRMTRAMEATLAALWEKRMQGLPIASPREALILASIVEKETAVAAERPRVAAVFVNRLRKGMRLESDPTVVYGLTGGNGALGRQLLRNDLKNDHPYNTYKIAALPPGPICNPGRDAIAAVLNPAATEELYFVADGTGGHVFAKTLDEHNTNVANWRKIRRENAKNGK